MLKAFFAMLKLFLRAEKRPLPPQPIVWRFDGWTAEVAAVVYQDDDEPAQVYRSLASPNRRHSWLIAPRTPCGEHAMADAN